MVKPSDDLVPLETLRQVVREVCEPRGVARVELFGSLAKGKAHRASDVDLLVEFLPQIHASLFDMGEIKELLEEKLGRPVDLVSRKAVENSKNDYRRRMILANPVTIYAR